MSGGAGKSAVPVPRTSRVSGLAGLGDLAGSDIGHSPQMCVGTTRLSVPSVVDQTLPSETSFKLTHCWLDRAAYSSQQVFVQKLQTLVGERSRITTKVRQNTDSMYP
jgi:hypothetical protein